MPSHNNPVAEGAFVYYRRLKKLKAYLDENPEEHISLAKASEMVGLSKNYFSTYFHQKTGTSFRNWQATYRVERAAAMLKRKNYTISEITFIVGYKDLRTFERAFKKLMGMTPSRYKKLVRPQRNRKF